MKILEKLFSIKNSENKTHKIVTILCIKFKIKRSPFSYIDIEQLLYKHKIETIRGVQRSITTALLHQKTFGKYQNCHNNQTIVLVGSGPTCKYYNNSNSYIHIALNSAIRKSSCNYDYVFMQDYEACEQYICEVQRHTKESCKVFYGYTWLWEKNRNKVIPNSVALRHIAERYYTNVAFEAKPFNNDFALSIDTEPLFCGGSVAFPAIQFALWTNPKRIYLVGCDCSTGHFDSTPFKSLDGLKDLTHLIGRWNRLKKFAERYYPETEIISINPVGLKSLFKDVYTKEYVEANPELFKDIENKIEYIDEVLNESN